MQTQRTPVKAPEYKPARRFNLAIALLDAWEIGEAYGTAKSEEERKWYLSAFVQIQRYIQATSAVRAVDRIPMPLDFQRESLL
jgi:hypothetical protein